MTKLMNIKSYWNMNNDWNFNEENIWQGQILLQEDGWFEGVVADINNPKPLDRFVFGVFHEGKILFLNKFNPVEGSTPYIYQGEFNGQDYIGEFDAFRLISTVKCGNTRLIVQEVEKDLEKQSQKLEMKIENLKITMIKVFADIYKNLLAVRPELTEEILTNYLEKHPDTETAKRVRG